MVLLRYSKFYYTYQDSIVVNKIQNTSNICLTKQKILPRLQYKDELV